MQEWLTAATEVFVMLIDAMALIVIAVGTIEAFLSAIRLLVSSVDTGRPREIWLRYSRWLVAGLTFQLAADIVETSIAPSWDDIGRLAAIALVRTFLNFFLERDIREVRRWQREHSRGAVEENAESTLA
jgi:uncharacterized membrane protein